MNLLLFTDADRVAPNRIAIQDARLQHLREVSAVKTAHARPVGEANGLDRKGAGRGKREGVGGHGTGKDERATPGEHTVIEHTERR